MRCMNCDGVITGAGAGPPCSCPTPKHGEVTFTTIEMVAVMSALQMFIDEIGDDERSAIARDAMASAFDKVQQAAQR